MQAKDSLSKRQCRLITALFREFLEILEEVRGDYNEFYGNLLTKLPPEYVSALIIGNPLSEEKFKRLRKKVLDKGNNVLRDSEDELGNFSISFCI